MKKLILITGLLFVLSPVFVSATSVNTQTEQSSQLIISLLQKISELQAQLQQLLNTTNKTLSVEVVSSNTEYQQKIGPIADLLNEKLDEKKALEIKLEESKCIKPFRFTSKGIRHFRCNEKIFHYSTTTETYIFDESDTVNRVYNDSVISSIFKMNIKGVQVYSGGWSDKFEEGTFTPPTVIIPPTPTVKMRTFTKEIDTLNKEITKINEDIRDLKLRYGISN